jgi:predicted O-methyltransferase YrrM
MITPEVIEEYCILHSSKEARIFEELSKATLTHFPKVAHMQVGPLEGSFLSLITKMMKAQTVLEFGTFTGYSSLCFAGALPKDGKVTTLDRDPKATSIAQDFWEKAQALDKIELILGDAKISLKTLAIEITEGKRPRYDLAFIDADKSGYSPYFESCFHLVRPGGLILIDNVLWSGSVLDPKDPSDHTIHAFNEKLKNDSRVQVLMLPVRDGITMAMIK